MTEQEYRILLDYITCNYLSIVNMAEQIQRFIPALENVHPNVSKYAENLWKNCEEYIDEIYKKEGIYIGRDYMMAKPGLDRLLERESASYFLERMMELRGAVDELAYYAVSPQLYEMMIEDEVPGVFDNPDELSEEALAAYWNEKWARENEIRKEKNTPAKFFESDKKIPEGFKDLSNPFLSMTEYKFGPNRIKPKRISFNQILESFSKRVHRIEDNLWTKPREVYDEFFKLAADVINSGFADINRQWSLSFFLDKGTCKPMNTSEITDKEVIAVRHIPEYSFVTIAEGSFSKDLLLQGHSFLLKVEKKYSVMYDVSLWIADYRDGLPTGNLITLETTLFPSKRFILPEEITLSVQVPQYSDELKKVIYRVDNYGFDHNYDRYDYPYHADPEEPGEKYEHNAVRLPININDEINLLEKF